MPGPKADKRTGDGWCGNYRYGGDTDSASAYCEPRSAKASDFRSHSSTCGCPCRS